AMRSTAQPDYERLREWLLTCIGIYQPVLTLVVKNTTPRAVTLTRVVYDVLDVGEVKGGATGPIYPEQTYDHVIRHVKGEQAWQLKPPLGVKPDESVSFNLRLYAAEKGSGLAWYLRVVVEDATGDRVATEPVQIVMSKGQ